MGTHTAAPLPAKFDKHHPVIVALHWGTVICIVVSVLTMFVREIVEDKFWRLALLDVHRQLGLLVMIGVAVRLGARLFVRMTDSLSGMPWPLRLAALATHCALYGLMVGLPLLGWATTSAHNTELSFLGMVHLPAIARANGELADELSDNHILAAWALLGLVALHAVAALYHHFVLRDQVLLAMLSGRPATAAPERIKTTQPV